MVKRKGEDQKTVDWLAGGRGMSWERGWEMGIFLRLLLRAVIPPIIYEGVGLII